MKKKKENMKNETRIDGVVGLQQEKENLDFRDCYYLQMMKGRIEMR